MAMLCLLVRFSGQRLKVSFIDRSINEYQMNTVNIESAIEIFC